MSEVISVMMFQPEGGVTAAPLTSFGPLAEMVPWEEMAPYFDSDDPNYDPDQYTHMISLQSSNFVGEEVRMLEFFTLDSASENTRLDLGPDSTMLSDDVDLNSMDRVAAPVNEPNLSIDWEYVTRTGLGTEWIPTHIDRIVVAHFDNRDSCDLEARFLELEESADKWWERRLTAVVTTIDLSRLEDAEGNAFTGITGDGTWAFALYCGSCLNPAPRFMTLFTACE